MHQTPSNIAMEGDPKWFGNLALNLKLLEVFNALSRHFVMIVPLSTLIFLLYLLMMRPLSPSIPPDHLPDP